MNQRQIMEKISHSAETMIPPLSECLDVPIDHLSFTLGLLYAIAQESPELRLMEMLFGPEVYWSKLKDDIHLLRDKINEKQAEKLLGDQDA